MLKEEGEMRVQQVRFLQVTVRCRCAQEKTRPGKIMGTLLERKRPGPYAASLWAQHPQLENPSSILPAGHSDSLYSALERLRRKKDALNTVGEIVN